MAKDGAISKVDESLVARLAALSPGGQRWLKTALQAIKTIEPAGADAEEETRAGYLPAARPEAEKAAGRSANLEDVITGKADLRDQLDSYPELAEELDGLGDVIDLLREAGEKRRKKGDQILREEILGERPRKWSEDEEPDEEEP
ncbi:MAG: hypothetical protein Q7T33_08450 [Dehalococcoidia bacterium]|nr:hypothetical protein [Dehalococcoidia bacterium]